MAALRPPPETDQRNRHASSVTSLAPCLPATSSTGASSNSHGIPTIRSSANHARFVVFSPTAEPLTEKVAQHERRPAGQRLRSATESSMPTAAMETP